jgi:hypothetical protein
MVAKVGALAWGHSEPIYETACNAWSIRGDVKDIFLPRPEGERFRDFQPRFVMRAVGFWFSAL